MTAVPHDQPPMSLAILAAGAAGMYCGSCLRDNTLASALIRAGQRVSLIPLYTPLKTDTPDVSVDQVFYGGINVYLQHASAMFRHTPRALDWLLDRPWLLNLTSKLSDRTSAASLGSLALGVLRGEHGPQIKELRRLCAFLRDDIKPDLISLPNAMFIGMAHLLRDEVGVPVICELTGEDVFLEQLIEPWRTQARDVIRGRCADVTRFVATSASYARTMSAYLDIAADRIDIIHPGISADHLANPRHVAQRIAHPGPPTIGYFARVAPEKGLDRLISAYLLLRRQDGLADFRLRYGGYLGGAHRPWHESLRARLREAGCEADAPYVGEVDLAGKLALLDSLDVFCVPGTFPEAKGIYVLEAMGRGLCVVEPDSGAYPELIAATGGGVITPSAAPGDLARAIGELLRDPARRASLGAAGYDAVRSKFTDDLMARRFLEICRAAAPRNR